ncbi:MAG: hypothetical protein KC423_00600 [Anaerolineales bacterium]|nr:hypothetical protein [Anaerolineales bacterium]
MSVTRDPKNRLMIRLASGQSVYAPTVITHPAANTLVALQMFGPEQAVKANWAALMNNNRSSHFLLGKYITLEGSKHHITLKKMLPCNWLEMWIIHKQASYQTVTPADKHLYFITPTNQPQTAVSHTFYLFLNKALATPLLPAWADYLWFRGLEYLHIVPITVASQNDAHAAYLVNTNENTWRIRIREGLARGEISLTP